MGINGIPIETKINGKQAKFITNKSIHVMAGNKENAVFWSDIFFRHIKLIEKEVKSPFVAGCCSYGFNVILYSNKKEINIKVGNCNTKNKISFCSIKYNKFCSYNLYFDEIGSRNVTDYFYQFTKDIDKNTDCTSR